MALRESRQRAFVVALLGAAAVVGGGCGGDGGAGGAPTPGAGGGSERGDAAAEVRTAFKSFEAAFQDGDAAQACSWLTRAARREAAAIAGAGRGATCERSLEQLAQGIEGVEQQPSKVLSVRVDGARARASISDAGRPPVSLPFVREAGGWRLARLGLGGP